MCVCVVDRAPSSASNRACLVWVLLLVVVGKDGAFRDKVHTKKKGKEEHEVLTLLRIEKIFFFKLGVRNMRAQDVDMARRRT